MVSGGGCAIKTIGQTGSRHLPTSEGWEQLSPTLFSTLCCKAWWPNGCELSDCYPLVCTVACDQALKRLLRFLESRGLFQILCLSAANQAEWKSQIFLSSWWIYCWASESLSLLSSKFLSSCDFLLFCGGTATVRGTEKSPHLPCPCCGLLWLG